MRRRQSRSQQHGVPEAMWAILSLCAQEVLALLAQEMVVSQKKWQGAWLMTTAAHLKEPASKQCNHECEGPSTPTANRCDVAQLLKKGKKY